MIACYFGSVRQACAQVSAYTFSNSAVTYSAISGTAMTAGTGWDDNVQNVAIPFTFTFNCIGYASLNISTNGFITFGATAPSTTNYTPISSTEAYAGAASVFGRDVINNAAAVTYTTVGTSPNREFVVQWTSARRYDLAAVTGDVLNFQIRLLETSNVVRFDYGTNTATNTTARTCQVGLRGATNTDFANRTATTSWSTTTAGGTNGATMTSSNTVMPLGRRYTYTPVACGNDACANAIAIASLPYTSAVIANALATDDSPTSTCDGPYKNVWWTVTGICGTMTAITCTGGTNFDNEIAVFTSTGGCSGPWTQVACNDDNGAGCTNNYAGVSWTATAGAVYYITVGS